MGLIEVDQIVGIQFTNIGPLRHNWTAEVEWQGEAIIREIKRHSVCRTCGTNCYGDYCRECNRGGQGMRTARTWPYDTPPDIWYDKTSGTVWMGGRFAKGAFKIVSATA